MSIKSAIVAEISGLNAGQRRQWVADVKEAFPAQTTNLDGSDKTDTEVIDVLGDMVQRYLKNMVNSARDSVAERVARAGVDRTIPGLE